MVTVRLALFIVKKKKNSYKRINLKKIIILSLNYVYRYYLIYHVILLYIIIILLFIINYLYCCDLTLKLYLITFIFEISMSY